MKQTLVGFSRRYATGLRKYLRRTTRLNLATAGALGRDALVLGLETLELAKMHERAVAALKLTAGKCFRKRARIFFHEVINPIAETHCIGRQNLGQMNDLNETLKRRTAKLLAANGQLKRDLQKSKGVGAALKRRGKQYTKLLKKSLQLQERWRQFTREALMAQEEERRNMSLELRDEVVQTLLGINVRLLSLKEEARRKNRGFKREVASTQHLVSKSVGFVRLIARKLRNA